MPDTRYSSTSRTPLRQPDGDEPGEAPTAIVPVAIAAAQGDGADPRRALENPPRRHATARCAGPRPSRRTGSESARWSGCRCRSPPARRLRRTHAAADRRRRRSGCSAGTSRAWPRSRPARSMSAGEHCTPWTTSVVRSRYPSDAAYSTGELPGGVQAGSQAPSSSSSGRQGPVPCCSSSTSSGDSARCTVVMLPGVASSSRPMARNSAGDTEYGACGATADADVARRARRPAGCAPPRAATRLLPPGTRAARGRPPPRRPAVRAGPPWPGCWTRRRRRRCRRPRLRPALAPRRSSRSPPSARVRPSARPAATAPSRRTTRRRAPDRADTTARDGCGR